MISAAALIFLVSALFAAPLSYQPTHAASSTGIIIPLYTYPGSTWDAVVAAKTSYPSVPIIAIINPNNGPGGSQDSNYVQGIQNLRSHGVVVLGYVYTGYGSRSSSAVEADISSYKSWYTIDGIMFDEMSNVAGFESYYSSLSSYANSLGLSLTVGNPGTSTLPSYVGTVNVLIIYEDAGLPALSTLSSSDMGYGKQNFGLVSFNIASLDTSFETSAANYVSYEYITDANLPNPYDSLPSYFTSLVATLSNASPPPPPPPTTVSLAVNSVDLTGNPITGLWTTIQSGGATLQTGYTPLTYSATNGTTYTVTVADYGSYTFAHWEDGSTNSSRTVTPSQAMTLTAYYNTGTPNPPPSTVTITVNSVDLSGTAITGLWTTIQSNSSTLATGYTPLTYNASTGATYTVTVANYGSYVFDHWEDGSTNSARTITPTQATTLTAYYKTAVTLTVKAAVTNSNKSPSCVSVVIKYQSSIVASRCAPLTYTALAGSSYLITVSPTSPFVFSKWSTGSTNSSLTITMTKATTLTAYFRYITRNSPVTFQTSPNTGSIIFNGTPYTNGMSGNYTDGSATATATPPINYHFGSWITLGGLQVLNASSILTQVFVNGSGTLMAHFSPNSPTPVTPSGILAASVSAFAMSIFWMRRPRAKQQEKLIERPFSHRGGAAAYKPNSGASEATISKEP